jgi:hypothetical protein
MNDRVIGLFVAFAIQAFALTARIAHGNTAITCAAFLMNKARLRVFWRRRGERALSSFGGISADKQRNRFSECWTV